MAEDIRIDKHIVFSQTEKEYLTADIYSPTTGEDLPVILLVHGGAFQSGSKEMYKEWGIHLAKSGFVAMAINYRLTTPTYATWPGVLDDVHAAVNYLVRHANDLRIDPLRMGMIGDSAGAHLVTLYSLAYPANASFKVQAVIGVYGVYNLEKPISPSGGTEESMKKLFGKSLSELSEDIVEEASPYHLVADACATPIFDTSYFIIWGEEDKVVIPDQSKEFIEKLKENSVEVQGQSIPDKGHFWFNMIPSLEGGRVNDYPNKDIEPNIITFLRKKLLAKEVGNFSMSRVEQLKKLM